MRQFLVLVLFISTSRAALECYFPFLEAGSTCGADSDCASAGYCIQSVLSNQRICCNPKAGTTSPQCPPGMTTGGLPILCDGSSSDACPSSHQCVPSQVAFTKISQSPSFVCCK
ncbi:unnamed protein product [Caenorhabditis auriculariae]|uniref:CC domain-containing protein n=1 Tax=Caenorhabditis auriculariae TaxID=2777116 RepID=A0A8S1H472_9PELO|nr:unnamed protein product [Caenorhabditis auriculariae]